MKRNKMPTGSVAAFAINPEVMHKCYTLSEEKKRVIIDGIHLFKSKNQIHQHVNSVVRDKR